MTAIRKGAESDLPHIARLSGQWAEEGVTFARFLEIYEVYVQPGRRSQGAGQRLVERMMEEAAESGHCGTRGTRTFQKR